MRGVPRLFVHLLDGFSADDVSVAVDGRDVADAHDVTSRLLEGHAATLEAEVPEGAATVAVTVPSKAASASATLPLEGDTHLLATFEDGSLRTWTMPRAPFFG